MPGGNQLQKKTPLPSPQASEALPLPLVQPVHTAVPGRVRLKIPALYRADHLKAPLEARLRALEAIHEVKINPRLGSLLLQFTPSLSSKDLILWVQQQVAMVMEETPGPKTPKADPQQPLNNLANVISIFEYWAKDKPMRPQEESSPRPSTAPSGAEEQLLWHCLEPAQAVQHQGSDAAFGLSTAEARLRLDRCGPNRLRSLQTRSPLQIFLSQFNSAPVWLLGVSAGIATLTGGWLDAAVILGVVFINATIGFMTERYAERVLGGLTQMGPNSAMVIRDNNPQMIPAEETVPGDVLVLAPGHYIPADARLLTAKRLTLDESALTGESLPVAKDPGFRGGEDTPLADRLNMVYRGTVVTGGSGRGLVTATGPTTEIGNLQALVGEIEPPPTPMERQLEQMGTQLALLSAAVCAGVYGIGLLRGYGWLEMLKSSISLAVAAVPEGLPPVATTTLALGMQKMSGHQVLIRRLSAVETLGSVQVICLDKTGTLTENRMSVVSINTGIGEITVNGSRFYLAGEQIEPQQQEGLLRLFQTVALCNEAELGEGKSTTASGNGSSTESALLEAAWKAGIEIDQLRQAFPRLEIQYRAEGRHYMKTLHAAPGGKHFLAVKGSPAQVLAMCDWRFNGKQTELQESERAAILAQNEAMAAASLRVLGVAYAWLEPGATTRKAKLIWLGLVGMSDPLRPGMAKLMQRFHAAGIDTLMITGDQSTTAYALGKKLKLAKGEQLQLLDSTRLEKVDPDLLAGLIQQVQVFSRVSPAHKLQIVQALQRAGKVVAMTGDGINDSPALKAADIGVAMGSTGTEVARNVADVVLEDDNLHSMIHAVEQGRTIYGNVRKSIHFLLATNFSEIEVMLISVAMGLGQPLNPMQLLWINLITDIFPALALALDPPDPEILNKPPRDPQEPIIQRPELKRMGLESAAITAGTLASYGYALARYGPGPKACTHAFTSLTLAQLLHSYSCRSSQRSLFGLSRPPNPYLNLAVGGSIALQALAGLFPGLRTILGLTSVNLGDSLVIGAGALVPFLINEISKRKESATPTAPIHYPPYSQPNKPPTGGP